MEEKRCLGCMKKKENPICEHCGYDEAQTNASHQLAAGTVLKEQYLIGRVLGQGGFGITYLGWDMYLDIPVAIKEYYPNGTVIRETAVSMSVSDCSGDDGSRFRNNKERFLREAKTLARFSQVPEVVQVRNFFLANNTAYIVMEYVEGITLKQYVQEKGGKLSVEETMKILAPVIETLCKIHKTGLVHRDISPDNIMMLPNGSAKLLDFGAVRDVGSAEVNKALSHSTEAILKQGYAPIEQYLNRGALGPWTDVYALCATIYYCLTGEVPLSAPERLLDDEDIQWKKMVPDLTAVQEKALTHGMQIRAENRTVSMDRLFEELFATPDPDEDYPSQKEKPEPLPVYSAPPIPDKKKEIGNQSKSVNKRQKKQAEYPAQKEKPEPLPVYSAPPVRRRKKLWLIICLILAAACVFAFCGNEGYQEGEVRSNLITNTVSGTCGDEAKWSLNRDTGELVITGSGRLPNYRAEDVFLHENNAYPAWNDYKSEIKSVTVKDGITYIGWCSFYGYENLKTVTIGATVERIGSYCFAESGLTQVALPNGLKTITEYAFANTPLTSITIPESVEFLYKGCFLGCTELRSVTVDRGTAFSYDFDEAMFGVAEDPGKVVFYGYKNTMAEDFAQICGHQFVTMGTGTWDYSGECGKNMNWYLDRASGLLKIEGEGTMYDYAGNENDWYSGAKREQAPWARYSTYIKTISIGDGVIALGEYAFANQHMATTVYWGNTLEVIPFHAFLNTDLTKVVLPGSVKTIENHAFNWCDQLKYVQLPNNLKKLSAHSFNACYSLEEFFVPGDTVLETQWGGITPFNQKDEMKLPENMTIYGLRNSNAEKFAEEFGFEFKAGYQGYKAEDEGQMGDHVWWMFSGDTLFIYGDGETWRYNLDHGDITGWAKSYYEKGKAFTTAPVFHKHAGQISKIVVLPGVDQLMNGLFLDMRNLELVDFGTITHCYSHFGSCTKLKEITFPETTRVIGGWLLNDCDGLEKITILNGSGEIEESAFRGCYGLKEIWFSGREVIREDIFGGSELMIPEDVTFYVKENSAAYRYAKQWDIPYVIY